MDIINLSIIFVILANTFLGALILKKSTKSSVNVSYAFVILSILFWSIPMVVYRISGPNEAVLLAKLLYAGAATTLPTFLLFSYYFPTGNTKVGAFKYSLILGGSFLVIYLSLFTNKIIDSVEVIVGSENIIHFGGWYYFYVAAFFYYFAHAYVKLFYKMFKSTGLEKTQVKYVVFGYFFASNLAFVTNLTLPSLGYFDLNWMGQVLTIIMVGSTTYAIIRFRFLDIKLIITRSILYFLLVATITSFFTFVIFLIREILEVQTRASELGLVMLASFIIVVALDPLKRYLSKITDDIFYKGKIDYDQVLKELSLIIAREIDMEVLLTEIRQGLVEQLKLKRVDILVNLDGYKKLGQSQLEDSSIDGEIVQYVSKTDGVIILDEIKSRANNEEVQLNQAESAKLSSFMDEMDWQMIIPVNIEGELNAIIALDYKLSGDVYSKEDINFFNILAPQIAVAIEKSKLYEEIGRFNRELQERVDRATTRLKTANVDLEDRNRYLTITQNISNLISRTLDINNIIQIIADSISTELGYVGGIISFVDEKGEYLYPAAITRSDQASRALALLPKPVSEYKASIKKRENLGVQALKTGSALTSNSFAEFFSPPVEKEIADNIQKAIKAITIVGVPIYSENKIIGVIHYLLSSREDQVSQLDYEMMNNLADQIGIVYRNVKLYQKLENTNAELQEANVHLKQLDKAKSEFLSIASHQLRTPTSAIKGYLSMVLEGDFGTVKPEQKKVITDVYESAARLARLINIFLNVSRIEAGRFKLTKQETDMNQLIEGVYTELKQQAETKGLKLELHLPEKAPMIFVDSDKVREVILNLVDNAIKYTQKGKVEVFSELTPEEYVFYTKDTGMGIRQDEVKTLFRKFVRGTGVAQVNTTGSGLGLYIAQRVIREHGGKIWAESDGLEKGSVFKFTIPLTKTKDIKSEHLDQE